MSVISALRRKEFVVVDRVSNVGRTRSCVKVCCLTRRSSDRYSIRLIEVIGQNLGEYEHVFPIMYSYSNSPPVFPISNDGLEILGFVP